MTIPTPYAAHSCGKNLTTKKRSRSINHSRGKFCILLFAQIFNWNLLSLTNHLLPTLFTNFKPHTPQGTIPQHQYKKEAG
jgi:hypothetical protein